MQSMVKKVKYNARRVGGTAEHAILTYTQLSSAIAVAKFLIEYDLQNEKKITCKMFATSTMVRGVTKSR